MLETCPIQPPIDYGQSRLKVENPAFACFSPTLSLVTVGMTLRPAMLETRRKSTLNETH